MYKTLKVGLLNFMHVVDLIYFLWCSSYQLTLLDQIPDICNLRENILDYGCRSWSAAFKAETWQWSMTEESCLPGGSWKQREEV